MKRVKNLFTESVSSIFRLFDNETETTMRVFSDHTGVIIDPYGIKSPNQNENRTTPMVDMRGIRISPRQSPFYQPVVINISIIFFYI